MNRIKPGNSNMPKPFQAQLIARSGLRTPATLVTNQPSEVPALRKHHGRIIYKSISANRSIVRELTPEQLTGIERIRTLPTRFQALIAGEDVRVHVVEDKVFATLVVSDAVDYRYAADQHSTASYEAVTLPEDRVVVRVDTGQLPPGECLVGERLTIRVRRGSKAELLFAHPEWTAAPAR